MKIVDYKECLEKNLIKDQAQTKNWVEKELKSAQHFLKEAEGIFATNYFDSCEIIAYSSMFHSTRALLYSKGYSERSHFCLFKYVINLFSENKELIEVLKSADLFRESRQDIVYDGLNSNKNQAESAIKTAKELLRLTKKYLGV